MHTDANPTGAPVAPPLVAPVVFAAPVAAFAPPTAVFPTAMPPTGLPPAMPSPAVPMMLASASALPTAATAMPALPANAPPPLPVLPPAAHSKLPMPPPPGTGGGTGAVPAVGKDGKETPADYLRALSLKQPFCSALVLGKRKQESRTWKIKLPHDGTGLWVAAHSPAKAAPAGAQGAV